MDAPKKIGIVPAAHCHDRVISGGLACTEVQVGGEWQTDACRGEGDVAVTFGCDHRDVDFGCGGVRWDTDAAEVRGVLHASRELRS